MKYTNLGHMKYEEIFELQKTLLTLRQEKKVDDLLLIVEHEPVITKGLRATDENILKSKDELISMNVKVLDIRRGGDVTYHGPGQIVGYPIVDLRNYGKGVRQFVEKLEEVFISYLRDVHDIEAGRNPENTGVWVGNNKITAIGLEIKKWISMHGFAFNVNTNLEHFKWIVPCGLVGKGVTSLEELVGSELDIEKVKKDIIHYVGSVYQCDMEELEYEALKRRVAEIIEKN